MTWLSCPYIFYLIFDSGGSAWGGELGRGFHPSLSIFIPGWFVLDYKDQWNVYLEILKELFFLVQNVLITNVHENGENQFYRNGIELKPFCRDGLELKPLCRNCLD